ncbi:MULTISPECIES: flagellar protein FlaG [unclassified Pseudomonas]|uniref:flagellar protein FlaG n=1 Tax=unclassified Pseudomonas TaxID=196821 RepID=UPI000BCF96CD|nr:MULTISPECIES: flagellar protein FlaG [unclassified Pseudomonas]PVZ13720.1 flagellar protein FlaG [Pseudomonas sp. URIL14HWK12:I12]PVZ24026.1 flagellar protein FlaG [Pseudomonas sp. URIL14HWK12:I10]PVZ33335.1 flagellar protein FlaG [Pseudomonas sp. URIL14HWK12:I11]SNZ11188.1 flagellar protein FlaG [Pseudomonas sp. URIL14HWK12:I9]
MDISATNTPSLPSVRAANPPVERPVGKDVPTDAANSAKQPPAKPASKEAVSDAVKQIDQFVNATRRNLDFSIDEGTGDVVVKVIASSTGEVIRQLPSEEALKLAESLKESKLNLFDSKA